MTSQEELTREQKVLHDRAAKRLRKRRDFWGHLLVYVLLNGFLVGIWVLTDQGFFWPGIVMGAWGIGLLANAWDVFAREIDEERIQREMTRLSRH